RRRRRSRRRRGSRRGLRGRRGCCRRRRRSLLGLCGGSRGGSALALLRGEGARLLLLGPLLARGRLRLCYCRLRSHRGRGRRGCCCGIRSRRRRAPQRGERPLVRLPRPAPVRPCPHPARRRAQRRRQRRGGLPGRRAAPLARGPICVQHHHGPLETLGPRMPCEAPARQQRLPAAAPWRQQRAERAVVHGGAEHAHAPHGGRVYWAVVERCENDVAICIHLHHQAAGRV
ncbi:hypothetical protein MNEG_14910, partial [Monoraphidium neglectum]